MRKLLLWGWIVAAGAATLTPLKNPAVARTPLLCLICGDLGGIDVLQNLVLFAPLGVLLAVGGATITRIAFIACIGSLGVETLQYVVIPGRDPALSDVLTNTAGAIAGGWLALTARVWLTPSPRAAGVLASVAGGLVACVTFLTGALQRTDTIYMDYFGQRVPVQPQFAPFSGMLHSFSIDEIPIGGSLLPMRDRYLARLRFGVFTAQAAVTPRGATTRLSAIARIANYRTELLLIGQDGVDGVFRYRSLATRLRFRTLAYGLPDAFADSGTQVVFRAERGAHGIVLRAEGGGRVRTRTVPFSVGVGWAMLSPLPVILTPGREVLSVVWLACLFVPVGYWAAHRGRAGAPIVGVSVALSLGVVPFVLGLTVAPWSLWAASLAGAWVGARLAGVLPGWLAR